MSEKLKGLKQWLHAGKEFSEAGDVEKLWNATSTYKFDSLPNTKVGFEKFKQRIASESSQSNSDSKVVRFSILKVAAAFVVLLVSIWLIRSYVFNADASMVSVITDAQTTKVFTLSDGTVITLNRNSQLIYPANFDNSIRKVQFNGEGFFEVAPDKKHPFVVQSTLGQIRVLGTKFNVRSFPNEGHLEVFVKEGRVEVIPDEGQSYKLDPGAFLQFDEASNKINLSRKTTENSIAWKTGKLSFPNVPVSDVVKAVERLYGVHATFENEDLANCPIYFNVNVGKLQDIWSVLETTCDGIDVEVVSDKDYVIHGHCCD